MRGRAHRKHAVTVFVRHDGHIQVNTCDCVEPAELAALMREVVAKVAPLADRECPECHNPARFHKLDCSRRGFPIS